MENFESPKAVHSFDYELAPRDKNLSVFKESAAHQRIFSDNEIFEKLREHGLGIEALSILPDEENVVFVTIPLENISTQSEIEDIVHNWAAASDYIGYGTGRGNVGFTTKESLSAQINRYSMGDEVSLFIPIAITYDE